MPRPSHLTPEEKARLLTTARNLLRAGVSRKDVAQNLGVKLSSLSVWLRQQTMDLIYPPLPPSMPRNRSVPSR